jgi:hypothetical protein
LNMYSVMSDSNNEDVILAILNICKNQNIIISDYFFVKAQEKGFKNALVMMNEISNKQKRWNQNYVYLCEDGFEYTNTDIIDFYSKASTIKETCFQGNALHSYFVLIKATIKGNIALVEFLLQNDRLMNSGNPHSTGNFDGYFKKTANWILEAQEKKYTVADYSLAVAAQNGHYEIVKMLLFKSANPKAFDSYSIKMAKRNNHTKVLELLG